MKKKLILFMMMLYAFVGYAQDNEVGEVTGPTTLKQNHNLLSGLDAPNEGIGIKGGLNIANMRGSDKDMLDSDISSHTSFHAGIFAQFALGETFSIQPEVLYTRKGYEAGDMVTRFDYLEVPVLAVFNFTDNISVHAGPQVGVMISGKTDDEEIDLEPYNTFDYGFAAGLEGRIDRFRLGARYNMGFADLMKENESGQSINQDIKNRVIQIYLGISF